MIQVPRVQVFDRGGIVPGNGVVESCPGRFWAKIGGDPSVSKSNCLHVGVFISVFFIEVYSIDSCKVIENLLKVSGLNWLICN